MATGRGAVFIGIAVLGAFPLAVTAWAQAVQELPEILVTTPSPILSTLPPGGGNLLPGALVIVPAALVPVTVVTESDIEMSPAANVGDLLFTRPGITATTFAPGSASRPIIRGLDNYRVRIQENGIGTHDLSTLGEDHAVPLDPLAIEQVEVIRGPATLRWGSQAIGGVVNAINNRIPGFLPAPGVKGELRGGLSSVDNGRDGAAVVDAAQGNFALHVDGFARASDDYRIPGGRQKNTAARSHGGSLGGSVFFDGGFAGLSVSHIDSLYHVPGEEAEEAGTHIDLRQTRINAKGEFTRGGAFVDKVRYWFGYTDYKHNEIGDEGAGPEVLAIFKNREYEGRVETERGKTTSALGEHSGALGFQFGRQEISTGGEASELLAPANARRFAGYIFEEATMAGGRRVQVAGRVEYVNVKGTGAIFPGDPTGGFIFTGDDPDEFGASRNFLPVSGSVAFLQDLPGGLIASLALQHVERAPEATELYSKGAHHASHTFEIGNPNLKVEAANSVEIGLKKPQGPLRFDATAYYTRYRNFIYKHLTGIECGHEFDECTVPPAPDAEFDQVFFAQRDATFYGVEIAGQLDVAPLAGGAFGVDGQYDFVHAKFRDETWVPRIPPHRLGGGLFWRNDTWFARVSLLHAFAQNRIAGEETATPGYNLLRAELSYRRQLANGRSVTLGLVGDNLLNERIRNHVSFNKDEVLLPALNVRGFAKVTF
ncbi:MAG: TonB-dependent receptor [Bradyrhizobiaceae bacterium]|nr:TonB-dependent receptor [Bradyrhizobiaceae bacterium]